MYTGRGETCSSVEYYSSYGLQTHAMADMHAWPPL